MSQQTNDAMNQQWNWQRQPQADALIRELVDEFLSRTPEAASLARRMLNETSTRFVDWVDFIRIPTTHKAAAKLTDTGYELQPVSGAPTRYIHEGAVLPAVLIEDGPMRVGIKVDWVADFLATWNITPETPIYGEPFSQLRMATAFKSDGTEMLSVERHGYRGFDQPKYSPQLAVTAQRVLESFRRRRRDFATNDEGITHTLTFVNNAIAQLAEHTDQDAARNYACDLFFHAERDFWQRRNTAARWQKARQDSLGIGWANHDHHTFRCSRKLFKRTIEVLETLGFYCRERFYAGGEAGWGAQVLEQPVAGFVIFADVDMAPEEVTHDFDHRTIESPTELGTVGLWTALHGDSILKAGMHHLECQFDHERLTADLEASGHKVMDKFTNFEFLYQAFTAGEVWQIDSARIDDLLNRSLITKEQAQRFREQGAVGSHLENLERNDGYKGFNQTGVSDIIRRTDARTVATA